MKETFLIKIDIDEYSPIDLLKIFHPYTIYGPTNIGYEYYPETRNPRKIGYLNIFCERKNILTVYQYPWFISFVKEIPNES